MTSLPPDTHDDQALTWGAPGSDLEEMQAEFGRRIAMEALEAGRQALELDAKTAFRATGGAHPG
ncbi:MULTISPECIES: hypothetical protein [Streptomyces]|uniref:Uncharacterized protein n=1 Tax=Streptomyces diastatochromogenes TaxID=42236 RepID=A0A233SGX7_STRDA|nr:MULTISPECIES: hypothetical protein [Streptomyces]MCZ0985656.1 hypothetical protein [Streptomyces diastatochromogenes]OXY94897.1 hypothetical protein BEK98_17390 [Streptomyces diastatochromogenes]SOE07727.1 hypothetical protein SAMN06272765_8640 [Streptomyces sp. Ag109_G2-15]